MPSRTVVYGVGAATGILVGAAIAQLSGATGRQRLLRLLGRGSATVTQPTHIVLPDLEPASVPEPVGNGVRAGAPLTPA
jgi:hypothetical protein